MSKVHGSQREVWLVVTGLGGLGNNLEDLGLRVRFYPIGKKNENDISG